MNFMFSKKLLSGIYSYFTSIVAATICEMRYCFISWEKICLVSNNVRKYLNQLKSYMIKRCYPDDVLSYAVTKPSTEFVSFIFIYNFGVKLVSDKNQECLRMANLTITFERTSKRCQMFSLKQKLIYFQKHIVQKRKIDGLNA